MLPWLMMQLGLCESKEKPKSSANDSEHNKEDQLEQEQEKETGEMKTNQVF